MIPALLLDARRAREEVTSGSLRGEALMQRILSVPHAERDAWVDALLALPELPADSPGLPAGAVPYLPAGVAEILALVSEAPLREGDELVDLGSGLGRVAILAHLLSGAPARGVEIQGPLVEHARRCSSQLGLDSVSFQHADAADAELEGSIFFLYAPFNGGMLTRVLRRLEAMARRRPMTLCTVDLELRGEAWLRARPSSRPSMMLYDCRPRDLVAH
jgi:SAM-dependent methyltransferase